MGMAERRSLAEGLKATPPPLDPHVAKGFIHGTPAEAAPQQPTPTTVIARSPLSTRMRTDFSTALKRASLERQLQGIEPSTLQDILEEAVEPWLRSKGYLS
jgi:hypothetical protein